MTQELIRLKQQFLTVQSTKCDRYLVGAPCNCITVNCNQYIMRVYDLQPTTLLAFPLPSQSCINSSADMTLAAHLRSMQRVAQSGRLRKLRCHIKQATRITTRKRLPTRCCGIKCFTL